MTRISWVLSRGRLFVHLSWFALAFFSWPFCAAADTIYYVAASAPNDSGVPNGNPVILENCWKSIGQAFLDLTINTGGDLTGKGKYIIQIQDSATYTEGVYLSGLTTTSNDYLTLRSAMGQRPVWKNDNSTVLFCNWDVLNSYGALKIALPYTVVEGINFTGTREHGIGVFAVNTVIRNCIFYELIYSHNNYNHNSAAIWTGNSSGNGLVYNNTFYNVITAVLFPDYNPATNIYRNNIFYINDCSVALPEQAYLAVDGFDYNLPNSDYNLFCIASGTSLAYAWDYMEAAEAYGNLAAWQACYFSPDAHSLSADPLLVAAGTDFHVKSVYGHWTNGGWVMDAETSPCLDAGAPYAAGTEYTYCDHEQQNNGGRVNLGAFANTDQASLSGWTPTRTYTPTKTPTRTCTPTATPTPSPDAPDLVMFKLSRNLIRVSRGESLNVRFYLSRTGNVQINIYNLSGSKITWVDETMKLGPHVLDRNCGEMGSGTYMVDFRAEGRQISKKVVIVK